MQGSTISNHFFNPHNVGDLSEPTAIGHAGSFTCGATIRFSLSVDASQRIRQAKFKAAGCTTLVAAASVLTDAIQGLTTAEAAETTHRPQQWLKALYDETHPDRFRCIALACNASLAAIANYSDAMRSEWEGDDALICTCFCVSERTIENEIALGLETVQEVTRACSAGAGCGSCHPLIQ